MIVDLGAALPAHARQRILRVASKYFGRLSAAAVHFTVMPGFLGSARNVMVIGMFTLLFSALFIGIATATAYYGKALERAKAEEELHLARRIQRSFLLSQFPTMPRLEVHAVNVSSRFGAVRMFRLRRSAVPSTPGTYCDRPLVGKSWR